MSYPAVPSVAQIADHFIGAVSEAERADWPFRHWKLREVFPEALCTAILVLPIAPPLLGVTDGTRGSYNRLRTFITPALQRKFPVCAAMADALRRPDVARSPGTFNSGVIFVPGPATWHGFDRRPIDGVRRLMEINYVRSDWRDRDQLAFPDG
jgi:hypothetical protein